MPKLTHPNSETVIEPKAEHAEAYRSQGWVDVAEKPKSDPKGK